MAIQINTAVWGYNYEWYPVKSDLEKSIRINADSSIEVNIFYKSFGDPATLKGVVKELRMTYSVDINGKKRNYELLVQEDP